MDLGSTSTSPIGRYDGRSVSELLTEARAEVDFLVGPGGTRALDPPRTTDADEPFDL